MNEAKPTPEMIERFDKAVQKASDKGTAALARFMFRVFPKKNHGDCAAALAGAFLVSENLLSAFFASAVQTGYIDLADVPQRLDALKSRITDSYCKADDEREAAEKINQGEQP